MSRDLSIVIPTYNEKDNVAPLAKQIGQALSGIDWEIIFVDDSPQKETADAIKHIAQDEPRIQLLRRENASGLSSAAIAGMHKSQAPLMAVMDADLQHDANLLKDMYKAIKEEGVDFAIGSRYIDQADMEAWSKFRENISRMATWLMKVSFRIKVNDPLSGFFMVRKEIFDQAAPRLNGRGQKIFLDLYLSSGAPQKFKELPYSFGARIAGKSKLDRKTLWENFCMFMSKLAN